MLKEKRGECADGKNQWRREGDCRKKSVRIFKIIPKDQIGNVTIQDEDEIEVLRFVGGG